MLSSILVIQKHLKRFLNELGPSSSPLIRCLGFGFARYISSIYIYICTILGRRLDEGYDPSRKCATYLIEIADFELRGWRNLSYINTDCPKFEICVGVMPLGSV